LHPVLTPFFADDVVVADLVIFMGVLCIVFICVFGAAFIGVFGIAFICVVFIGVFGDGFGGAFEADLLGAAGFSFAADGFFMLSASKAACSSASAVSSCLGAAWCGESLAGASVVCGSAAHSPNGTRTLGWKICEACRAKLLVDLQLPSSCWCLADHS